MLIIIVTILSLFCCNTITTAKEFSIKEATICEIQLAFKQNILTSRKLVEYYIEEIQRLNPILKGVIEVNPESLSQADKADYERRTKAPGSLFGLHGIPILLKDNIGTKDKLNTTAGSFALLGSVVPRDAAVVAKLRKSGAIILGKASLTEWASFRSLTLPNGWSARGGQGKNPYVLSADPCGSSSGSAISTSANLVTVSVGTETDGSILCPASFNSVVGIKPTVGLTSRDQVIPVSPRQDTVGCFGRSVSDAVYVLDVIAGIDYNDPTTTTWSKYIPQGGFKQYLKPYGLKGKRLGIVRNPFFDLLNDSNITLDFENHFQILRREGAIVVDNLEISNVDTILNPNKSGEAVAIVAEFKLSLNAYLKNLVVSPVRSLADVIAFNDKNADLEMIKEFGQEIFLASQATNGIGETEKAAIGNLETLTTQGFEKVMRDNELDALVTPGSVVAPVLAIGGFPGINVPAGYDSNGVPFGINFGGLKGSEAKLIEIAYGFEKATMSSAPQRATRVGPRCSFGFAPERIKVKILRLSTRSPSSAVNGGRSCRNDPPSSPSN
ncbi:putative amidase [Senna tora]|uniref:Putative amidase n=1 Tax=Senna tora TaxID=362788 RepID=A0A834W9Q6_9FABA|nr:putative amidase [Senna tora]